MTVCLNPSAGHIAPQSNTPYLMCPHPNCGFLMTGTVLEHWQVTHFVRRHGTTDSYLAISTESAMSPSTASVRERKFVKVFRLCPPGFFPRMEKLIALHHPSLHPYQDIGRLNQNNSFYLLSQYEERGSLARYLASKTPLPFSTITSVLLQIAHALQYLHERNLVHGRVRPENSLIVDRARAQVSDFYHGLLTR